MPRALLVAALLGGPDCARRGGRRIPVPERLSAPFHFPNVTGALRYLPGMLIIGSVYYALMSVLLVLMQPALRRRHSDGAAPD